MNVFNKQSLILENFSIIATHFKTWIYIYFLQISHILLTYIMCMILMSAMIIFILNKGAGLFTLVSLGAPLK